MGRHAEAGEESTEEGTAETKLYKLTAPPIPQPPALLNRRKEKSWSEFEPGKKGRVGEGDF